MRPATPAGWQAMDAAYAAVKPFPPRDQVTPSAWAIIAVLSALREKSKDTPAARATFDHSCAETVAYLTQQIAALRFTKAQ